MLDTVNGVLNWACHSVGVDTTRTTKNHWQGRLGRSRGERIQCLLVMRLQRFCFAIHGGLGKGVRLKVLVIQGSALKTPDPHHKLCSATEGHPRL